MDDLELFKKLSEFRLVDSQLPDEAIVVHKIYCFPEVLIFSLFSRKLFYYEKSRLASRLLTHEINIPKSKKLERPKFPQIDQTTELLDLVTPQSYRFYKILGLDYQ